MYLDDELDEFNQGMMEIVLVDSEYSTLKGWARSFQCELEEQGGKEKDARE